MATVSKRGNAYRIKVSCGYNSQGKQVNKTMTWHPDPKMTPKQIEKELNRQVCIFRSVSAHKPLILCIDSAETVHEKRSNCAWIPHG